MTRVMENRLVAALLFGSCMIAATPAKAKNYGPFKPMDTALGKVLTDARGTMLYTFDKDAKGKSSCNGECAETGRRHGQRQAGRQSHHHQAR